MAMASRLLHCKCRSIIWFVIGHLMSDPKVGLICRPSVSIVVRRIELKLSYPRAACSELTLPMENGVSTTIRMKITMAKKLEMLKHQLYPHSSLKSAAGKSVQSKLPSFAVS